MKLPIFIFILIHRVGFTLSTGLLARELSVKLPDLKNWDKADETREYFPENLFDYINGAADSYLNYQFRQLWVKEYNHANGAVIKTEIYEHRDDKEAFGIYSLERLSRKKSRTTHLC